MIVWMDGIVFKVRENGKVVNKTVYLCVGLNKEGIKEGLGMWLGKTESASFPDGCSHRFKGSWSRGYINNRHR